MTLPECIVGRSDSLAVRTAARIHGGQSLALPAGCEFQFRTVGAEPFVFIMCTLPPWPGDVEAIPVAGKWEVVDGSV